jgi:Tol biopolymer transport system component
MRTLAALLLIVLSKVALSQTPTEILLFELKVSKDKVSIGQPKNITHHKGYDNQPSFHSNEPLIYYSSFNDDDRADIKSYNYNTGETKALTQSNDREYSPALTLDKQYVSCVIQRDNGAQDLGKYPVQGGEAMTIIDNMVIGYYVWMDNSHVGLFVLGKNNQPHSLHYLRLPTKADTVIAENIGRSLHRVPNEDAFSFIEKVTPTKWFIKKFYTRKKKGSIYLIAETPLYREDICWTPDGKIVLSDDTKILWMDPKRERKWKEVEIESGAEQLKGATRVCVSPDGKFLAVVVAE